LNKMSESKYLFTGTQEDKVFFKTQGEKKDFVQELKKATKDFIDEQDKRRSKSIETSMIKIF